MYRQIQDGKLQCRDCKEWVIIKDFKHNNGQDGRQRPGSYCKSCNSKRSKRDLAKVRYGLTAEQFEELERAFPVCGICGYAQVFIDHSHDTGQVRGRLCRKCNTGIGMFLDKPDLLQKAAQYLTRFCGSDTIKVQ